MSHSPFAPLLLISLLAVLVPVAVSRLGALRLPVVVGEILAGIVIGRSGLDLVEPTPTLTFLKEFGFVFLMFLSGLEINVEALLTPGDEGTKRPFWQRPMPLAVLTFGLTLVLAIGVGSALQRAGLARDAILMGLILSTTSLGIVVPVLKERGLISSRYGQTLLVTALLSDFATLLLLSFVIALLSHGLGLDLLLFMVLLGAFAAAARFGPRVRRIPLLTRAIDELSHATAQIRVRGAVAIMVAWVVLAEGLGVEVILGAFLAGAVVSLSGRGHQSPLPEKLDAIGYGFFIPLFFIMVGVEFDLGALRASTSALLLVPLLVVAAYAVKLLPALLFRAIFGWREALAAGLLLSSRLSLIIAASAIALDLDIITTATNSAIILVAIVTCTFSPLLFGRILPRCETERRDRVIIVGASHLAELLGERLRRSGAAVTFIGGDRERIAHLERLHFRAIAGDPADAEVLAAGGATSARALIVVSSDAPTALEACRLAGERFGVPTIIVRADDPRLVPQFQQLGAQIVQPVLATALALEAALRFPTTFGVLLNQADAVDVLDVLLHNPEVIGRALRQVRLPGNALVLGLVRKGDVIVPHGETRLQRDDLLMLIGSPSTLRTAQQWLDQDAGRERSARYQELQGQ